MTQQDDNTGLGLTQFARRRLPRRVAPTLAAALLCNLALQWLVLGADLRGTRYYLLDRPLMVTLGAFLTWVVLILLWALVGRIAWALGLLFSLALVTGFASYQKFSVTREPLYPQDLSFADNASFLAHMLRPTTVVTVVVAVSAVLTIAVVGGRLVSGPTSAPTPRLRPGWLLIARGLVALTACATLWWATQFNEPGNAWRSAYDASGAVWAPFDQTRNYAQNGFVGGFLYNTHIEAMPRPAGYGEKAIEQMVARYERAAKRDNRGRSDREIRRTNVVVVLSEALSDPTRLTGFQLADDPMPFTRSLLERQPSGWMLAQKYGTGTANMEFQALTGQSTAVFSPRMDTPYQMLVPQFDSYPSMVEYFEALGHRAVALHPYDPNMYQRQRVYPALGFDEFVDADEMSFRDRIDDNPFISDRSAFDQVLTEIEKSAAPLFLNVVTMQNHYDYDHLYRDPARVTGLDADEAEPIGTYARGLRHTDDAIARFLGSLKKSPEPTIVLFYGDHLPGAYQNDILIENGRRVMHETPFFYWANHRSLPSTRYPTTSPIHFLPQLLDLLGAPVPPYVALLDRLRDVLPALEHGMYIGADDHVVPETRLSERARRLLRDYRMVQYDLSVGQRLSEHAMFEPPTASRAR